MKTLSPNTGLTRLYDFFNTTGLERLSGLDRSYFEGLSDNEKLEAWNFLKNNFPSSGDKIAGLFLLNARKALDLFKEQVVLPLEEDLYPEDRREMEENRMLMLRYIVALDKDEKYVDLMNTFAMSEFDNVRADFAEYLPVWGATIRSLEILKGMIFTETKTIPISSAIRKFMAIYGLHSSTDETRYKALYRALRLGNEREKIAAITQIESRT
jgi:hypothetical protein